MDRQGVSERSTTTSAPDNVAAGTAARPVLPPPSAVLELLVLVLAINFVDWLLPSQDLADVGPNPYWVPVLLLTLQYGTVSGLLAAGVGIAMTMLPGVPEQGVGENHFAYLLRIWAQPILWVGVAVLLGQFRMRQLAAKQVLARRVEELGTQRQALADYAANLRRRCERLEREAASRAEVPSMEALAAASHLVRQDVDLALAFPAAITAAMPGAAASIFIATDGGLERAAQCGWFGTSTWADELTVVHPLHRAVVGRGDSVSVLTAAGEAALSGEGVAAVPIRAASGSAVIGMLKIESADERLLSRETLPGLEAIAAILALRFARLGDHGAAPASQAIGEASPLPRRRLRDALGPVGRWRRGTGRAP